MNFDTRYLALVRSVPVLARYAPGLDGVDVDLDLLDRWAAHDRTADALLAVVRRAPCPGAGAVEAARWVLSLWASDRAWLCGRHELRRAWQAWDADQRAAWLAWAAAPWWP